MLSLRAVVGPELSLWYESGKDAREARFNVWSRQASTAKTLAEPDSRLIQSPMHPKPRLRGIVQLGFIDHRYRDESIKLYSFLH